MEKVYAFIRQAMLLFFVAVSMLSFSGCVAPPPRQDPFADLQPVDSAFKSLKLGLIVSNNTKQTIDYLNKRISLGSFGTVPAGLDPNKFFQEITNRLIRNFREVVRLNSLQEAATSGVDLLVILDVYADMGLRALAQNVVQNKLIFMSPDGVQIDVVIGEGKTTVSFPAYKSNDVEAADASIVELDKSLSSSEKLKQYARGHFSTSASAMVKRESESRTDLVQFSDKLTSIVKSDVDELPLVKTISNKNSYAIVIGIESYRQKLPRADFATHDAKTVTEYLTEVMGYPKENVVTLLNDRASKSDFEKYFGKWLSNNVDNGNTIFVYYSGHGAPNPKTGDAYLVPYDGDPAFIDETGYSLNKLYAQLGKLKAKEIVVALDSCFSGAGGRSVIAKGSRPLVMNLQSNVGLSRNMVVLSASSGDQTSSTYDEKSHGLFTYFMLKGIKNEDVVQHDGSLKIENLYRYIKPQVERIARKHYNNEQTPQLIGPKR